MKRFLRTSICLSIAATVLAALPAAGASVKSADPDVLRETSAAAAPRARVSVQMRTPAGVPVTVALKRKRGAVTVAKPAKGRKATRSVRVQGGKYAVKPRPVILNGRLYLGQAEPATVRAKRAAGRAVVRVTYRAAKVADRLDVTGITSSSVAFKWRPIKGSAVQLRRSVGATAPASVKKGKRVAVRARVAKDTGLRPGTKYSYSLFTKVRGKWSPPVTVTAGTPPKGGSAAAYAANPTAVLVAPGTRYQAVPTGPTSIRVVLPAGSAPVLGGAVALPSSLALPGGYVGRVTAIAPDGRTVALVPAALDEVFDYLDVSITDWSGPTVAPEVLTDVDTVPDTTTFSGKRLMAGGTLPSCLKLTGGHELTYSVSFKPGGDFKGKINKVFGVPTSAQLTVSAYVTTTASLNFKTTAEVKCGLAFSKVFVPMGAVGPVPISFYFSPTVGFNAKTAVEVSNIGNIVKSGVKVTGKFGIAGPALTGFPIAEVTPLTPKTTTNGQVGFTVGGEVVVGPGAGSSQMGVIAGISGKLNLIDLAAGPKFPLPDSRWNNCLAVTGKTSLGFAMSVKAWVKDWSYSDSVTLDALKKEWPWGGWHWPGGCENLELPTTPITSTVLGSGVTVISDETSGSPEQWSHLDGFVPGEKVWLLSTGMTSQTVGTPDFVASSNMGGPGSPALSALAGGLETYDTAAYRVTVVPSGTRLHVRYLFASEEYHEWVGSSYNDVMGVFIDGVNCAYTPSGEPVSVNTINRNVNSHLFVDNESGAAGYNTTMDGLTVPLACTVPVTPGQPVQISVAVADTSDGILDSAVALVDGGIFSD